MFTDDKKPRVDSAVSADDTPEPAKPLPPKAMPPNSKEPPPAEAGGDSSSRSRTDQSKKVQHPSGEAQPAATPPEEPAVDRRAGDRRAADRRVGDRRTHSGGDTPWLDTGEEYEIEVELEGKPTGKKGASKRRKTAGDEPRQIDPKQIIARLAEKNDVILDLTRKNKALQNECNTLKDKVLRSAAEFDNFRKRSRKEWELLKQQTKADVVLEVLQVVDDFERAFSVVGERNDDFVQGIRLIHNNLIGTLDKLGVQRIEARHAPFDPNFHMAVAQIDNKDVKSGHVVEIVQEGYTLDGTVIRPTRVVIAK